MATSMRGLATSKGQALAIVNAISLVLIIVIGGLRFWAKRLLNRCFEIHDCLAFGSMVFSMAFAVDSFLCVYPGTVGMHLQDAVVLGPRVMKTTLKMFYASGFLWIASTTLIKMSILHFYRSIFLKRAISSSRGNFLQHVAHAIYVFTVLYFIAQVTLLLRICKPISLQWDSTQSGHCGDITKEEISSAGINMILDASIFVLPMPALWTLQIPLRKKIAVNAIPSLGLCICVINIVRLILVATSGSEDFTYSSAIVGLLTGLEVYIGLISATLPTLGPLLQRDKLASEIRNQKCHLSSRSQGRLAKLSKKRLGDSLLRTNRSFEVLDDEPAYEADSNGP